MSVCKHIGKDGICVLHSEPFYKEPCSEGPCKDYKTRKGKWIHDDFGFHCSECWASYPEEITDELNECPNCGADMRGE